MKRVFLIVLDSVGIGEMPDASLYNDEGSNTLFACSKSDFFSVPNLQALGLCNIDGVTCRPGAKNPAGSFARMTERSRGKDTTIGHWEIAGIESHRPLPTYPHGFPAEIIEEFERLTGRQTLCNRPYSGTQAIADFGREHVETGALIVYTSADSVFQVAAHEGVVPLDELYRCCAIAREILTGEHAVGRVIARPFTGSYPNFKRTSNRHDFSLKPPAVTMLDQLSDEGFDVIAVGKINDIFAGRGITRFTHTTDNDDGMKQTSRIAQEKFHGLCFVNLVDFDMVYGHRNDTDGYAKALSDFDGWLGTFLPLLQPEDILIITADHGCDPSMPSTDHSREYTPMLITGHPILPGRNLGTRSSFADIGATILRYFDVEQEIRGCSFLKHVQKELF